MNPENEEKLWRRIAAAGSTAVAKNGYVTAIDALLGTGWLRPVKVDGPTWKGLRSPSGRRFESCYAHEPTGEARVQQVSPTLPDRKS
jgi:hypothetical protein